MLTKKDARMLHRKCDKNTAWRKLEEVTKMWLQYMDLTTVTPNQIQKFKDYFMGFAIVAMDKGEPVKMDRGINIDRTIRYNCFIRSLDMAGIPSSIVSDEIVRMTLYPNGTLKVEYAKKRVEWI